MNKNFHFFHIVSVSPWPLFVGLLIYCLMTGMVVMFMDMFDYFMIMVLLVLLMVILLWWRDVVRESYLEGAHSLSVVSGLSNGMVLFILSEVFFFISFFWSYLHYSLSPPMELGCLWPPMGVESFSPFHIPLLNTVILLGSGVSVTWAHQNLLVGMIKSKEVVLSLMITWGLGVYFLLLQSFEYYMAMFDMSDSVYGSIFFMATGFHGFHVILGSLFLITMWYRAKCFHFSEYHHFGFEASAWYWHFVDVVWLFLFSLMYWWGSY